MDQARQCAGSVGAVDTLDLKTKAQRAEFSLLYTMALDRNHFTIPNLHIIEPAERYYERYGSKDAKMKMFFLSWCGSV